MQESFIIRYIVLQLFKFEINIFVMKTKEINLQYLHFLRLIFWSKTNHLKNYRDFIVIRKVKKNKIIDLC